MARYAVWRRRPEDPTTAAGWLLPKDLRSLPTHRRHRWLIVNGTLGAVVFLAAWAMGKPLFVIGFLGTAAFGLSNIHSDSEAESHAGIPTLAKESEAIPVTLAIIDAKGKTTGKETGWVAFADGWLVYEGLRTNFSLDSNEATHPEPLTHGFALLLRDGRRIELEVLTDVAQTELPSRQIDVPKLAIGGQGWLSGKSAKGEAVLPPRQTHPEFAVGRLVLQPALAIIGILLSALVFWGGLPFAAPFLLAAFGCLAWWVVGLARFRRDLPSLIE